MGCCASATSKAPPSPPHSKQNRAPPPPLEEETVKEVLSETPTPKPKLLPKIEDEPSKATPIKPKLVVHEIQEQKEKINNNARNKLTIEELSEVSEICSTFSESVSTTTLTESRDDDGEVRQRVANRSPAKFRNRSFSGDLKKERVVGKSPVRRSDPSPGRVRSLPGRDRRGYVANSGESSCRRSKSPATRANGGTMKADLCRSPSVKKIGKSSGRVGSDLSETNRKVEEGNLENNWPPTTDESLENPLVSLECFIFLEKNLWLKL